MSNLSTAYDKIVEKLAEYFTTATRIPYSESIIDNEKIFLRSGYGLRYDGATRLEAEFSNIRLGHNFTVILSREVIRLESDYLTSDTAKKALLEDSVTVQKNFFAVDQLGIADTISNIDINSVSPITKVEFEGNGHFIYIEISFLIELTESYVC